MQRLKFMYIIACLIAMGALSGCAMFMSKSLTMEEAESRVSSARDYFEVVKSIDLEDTYKEDVLSARSSLEAGESYLEKGRHKKAYEAATESLKWSRKILNHFYRTSIAPLAGRVKEELEVKARSDAHNPLNEYIPKLTGMVEYADNLEKGTEAVSLKRVLGDLNGVLEATQGSKTDVSKTLQSDISFREGRYDLSEAGESIIRSFMSQVLQSISPDHKNRVTVKVKVVGYTDELDFGKNSSVANELMTDLQGKLPEDSLERRKVLNKRLSEYRSKTIVEYIKTIIPEIREDMAGIKIDPRSSGRGEELPAGVPPPYPTPDERRRICKIYVYTVIK